VADARSSAARELECLAAELADELARWAGLPGREQQIRLMRGHQANTLVAERPRRGLTQPTRQNSAAQGTGPTGIAVGPG
jgi:hypothetical protein